MMWNIVSRYWSSALGLLVAGLAIAAKYYKAKAKKQKKRADNAVAQVKRDHAIAVAHKKIDIQTDLRLQELADELEDTGTTDAFRDPNSVFKDPD